MKLREKLPAIFVATLVIGLVGGALLATSIEAAPQDKVTICHKGMNTISVSRNALPAHIAHGDEEGACAATATATGTPTATASATATSTATATATATATGTAGPTGAARVTKVCLPTGATGTFTVTVGALAPQNIGCASGSNVVTFTSPVGVQVLTESGAALAGFSGTTIQCGTAAPTVGTTANVVVAGGVTIDCLVVNFDGVVPS